MILPLDLARLIQSYLNSKNILIFIDIVDRYNEHNFQFGYGAKTAEEELKQLQERFTLTYPSFKSHFDTITLNDDNGQPDKDNQVTNFDFDNADGYKITNKMIMDFISNYYLQSTFYDKEYTIRHLNTYLYSKKFDYGLVIYSNGLSRWAKLL